MPRPAPRIRKSEPGAIPALVFGTIAGLLLAFLAPGPKAPDPDAPPPPTELDLDVVGGAAYAPETFDAGSLIIPMDECHQYSGQTANANTRLSPLCYCRDTASDTGQIRAYGLAYRMLENGIPIRILIDDAKTAIDGVDASVTGASAALDPVKRLNRSGAGPTGTETAFYTSACASGSGSPRVIGYRGAPFVVPAAYAAQARTIIKSGSAGVGTPVHGAFAAADFSSVDVHVAQTAFTAKVARRYSGTPKPLALLNLGAAATDVLIGYLNLAGLNTAGAGGTACAPGTIYGTFSAVSDFTTSDCLTVGGYTTLWAPHWEPNTSLASTQSVIDKISTFVDSGRALFAECASIEVFEGSFNHGSQSTASLSISSASYNSGTRRVTVTGTGTNGTVVNIKNANSCTVLGTRTISGGTFSWVSAPLSPNSAVPCRIAADGGGNLRERNVSGAPGGCSPSGFGGVCSSTTAQCNNIDVDSVSTAHYHTTNGMVKNAWGLSFTAYGNGVTGDSTTEGFVFRDVTNVFVQKGDTRLVAPVGVVGNWKVAEPPTCTPTVTTSGGVAGASTYLPNTTQFISSCSGSDYNGTTKLCNRSPTQPITDYVDEDSAWDLFAYRRKDDDPAKGPIIYLGGHNYGTGSYGANNTAGVRLVLNTLINLEGDVVAANPKEVVRSAPVVADILAADGTPTNTLLQGTFMINDPPDQATTFVDAATADEFRFPADVGHVFAIDTSDLADNTSTEYIDLDEDEFLWDAADHIPPAPTGTSCTTAFNGSCRTLFTSTATGGNPARIMFNKANRSTFEAKLGGVTGADADSLIDNIYAGRAPDVGEPKEPTLGGIDWSSMAVIEASPALGTVRPTMVYVGGLDGMLHAFCANTVAPCTQVGAELWAYIPRTQLGALRYNQQRIDGAPRVADMYGDFDANGTKEIRTILVFQTGHGDPANADNPPAVIALDISSPGDPKILWEVATPVTRGANEQGEGMGLAMGPVKIGPTTKGAVFFSTNNGGTGTSGMYVQALDVEDGTPLWDDPFVRTYPVPTGQGARGGTAPPNSGIPGGIAGVDLTNSGTITHLVVPTLYGELYVVEADTGLNPYSDAIFRFSDDLQPIGSAPTIYEDGGGTVYAVVISGGYVDPDGATWTDVAGTHYAAAVSLTPTGTLPLTELGADNADRPFVIDIVGQVGFSSATIAGGELFFTTADHDVNDLSADNGTGKLYRINLLTGAKTSETDLDSSGAASVEATVAGTVYAGSLEDILKIDPAGFNGVGATVEVDPASVSTRRLWLRTE